jgi:hypothetical protein
MQTLISYLEKVDPASLEALRRRHPSQRQRFTLSGDLKLGDATDPSGATLALPDPDKLPALIDSLDLGTAKTLSDLEQLIPRIIRRLTSCNWAKVVGGFTSASAGAVAAWLTVSGAAPSNVALATAVIAGLGGVCTLVAGQFERSPSGARVSLAADVEKLITLRAAVQRMRRRLSRQGLVPIDEDAAQKMLDQLDEVAESLSRLSVA